MKKLNQNNAIAPTAMLTKLNTMKDKMNFFAKVVILLVMMVMAISNKCYSQDLSWFQGNDGTWYIYNSSLQNEAKDATYSSGESSIYLPSSNAPCRFDYSFTEERIPLTFLYKEINFFVKIGRNDFNDFCFAISRSANNQN